MLVWFTDTDGKSVAVDNRQVITVYEQDGLTHIDTVNGFIPVEESSLEVVSRLNTSQ